MHHLLVFAGLAWNPGIRGILVVAVGVTVLVGSVYLLLGTNLGARLGLLVVLAGLFGWLSILSFVWLLAPPANGPRGNNPSWKPVEIYVNGPATPKTAELAKLPEPQNLPSPDRILADHPELAKEYPNGFVLSDLQGSHPEIVKQYLNSEELHGWRLVSSANAGESQSAADVALVNAGVFKGPTDYKKLNTFEYGGRETREQACPDNGALCRAWFRITSVFNRSNPTHYAVVQVQKVVTQEAVPGEPPPLPKVDSSAPVISVVLVRNLGDVRLIPFLYFVICLSLFVIFASVLHHREKVLNRNKAEAEELAGKS